MTAEEMVLFVADHARGGAGGAQAGAWRELAHRDLRQATLEQLDARLSDLLASGSTLWLPNVLARNDLPPPLRPGPPGHPALANSSVRVCPGGRGGSNDGREGKGAWLWPPTAEGRTPDGRDASRPGPSRDALCNDHQGAAEASGDDRAPGAAAGPSGRGGVEEGDRGGPAGAGTAPGRRACLPPPSDEIPKPAVYSWRRAWKRMGNGPRRRPWPPNGREAVAARRRRSAGHGGACTGSGPPHKAFQEITRADARRQS